MRLTGVQPIVGTTTTANNFWSWTLSDLRSNTVRSRLAEYLVALVLRAASRPPVEWDSCDVVAPGGLRVEVKSGGYVQAWAQRAPSKVVFSGLRSRPWSPEASYASSPSYNADVYVFAVATALTHHDYDALNTASWSFWVLPRRVLEESGQMTIGLPRVMALAGDPVTYEELKTKIYETAA